MQMISKVSREAQSRTTHRIPALLPSKKNEHIGLSISSPLGTLQRSPACVCGGDCPRCAPIQTKLIIGQPGDKYEQEADRIADQVMRVPDPGDRNFQPQTLVGSGLQAKRADGGAFLEVTSHAQIHAAECPGCSLPQATRDFFEPRFEQDFSRVRVHTCDDASQMCNTLQARAFTHSTNIFFSRGAYDPASSMGKKLLAHELTHVVQQSSNTRPKIQRWPEIPIIGPLDVCIHVEGQKVCGSDAKSVCEKNRSIPGCNYVCKMLGCKEPLKERGCPLNFHPARSSMYKGLCCIGEIEGEHNCCPASRAASHDRRCCKEGEIAANGLCKKTPDLPPICPLWWKTTTGKCCYPPSFPQGPICVVPDKPAPPTPKPPVAPPVPKPKEIFFRFDRPRTTETKASALKGCTTSKGYRNFEELVAQMKLDSTLRVQLVGKASPEGPYAYNLSLGARRAELAKAALVDMGISASRILDPPMGTIDPNCQKVEAGVFSCGEIGTSGDDDRQVNARLFRGK